MKKNTQIHVSLPCYESWETMLPSKGGRLCESCQKKVVDFTNLNDREILHLLSQDKGQLCGRFRQSQLNRDLRPSVGNRSRWWKITGLAIMGWLGIIKANAQTIIHPTNQSTVNRTSSSLTQLSDTLSATRIISGKVTDEEGEPLIGATILIKGTLNGAMADFDGAYQLPIPQNIANEEVTLQFSYTGFETQEIRPGTFSEVNVRLAISDMILEEIVVVGLMTVRQNYEEDPIPVPAQGQEVEVTSMTDPSEANISMKCFPNPFSDHLTIEFELNKTQPVKILVSNEQGQTLAEISRTFYQGLNQYALEHLKATSGIVYVTLTDGEGTVRTIQAVKAK